MSLPSGDLSCTCMFRAPAGLTPVLTQFAPCSLPCRPASMPNQACCWRGAWLLLIVAFTAHQAQQCHGQVTGEVVYNAPGTYTFTPPSGVTSVSVVCVAAGGGSGTYLGWPTAVVASGGWRVPAPLEVAQVAGPQGAGKAAGAATTAAAAIKQQHHDSQTGISSGSTCQQLLLPASLIATAHMGSANCM